MLEGYLRMHWCHGPVTVPIFVDMHWIGTVNKQDRTMLSQVSSIWRGERATDLSGTHANF